MAEGKRTQLAVRGVTKRFTVGDDEIEALAVGAWVLGTGAAQRTSCESRSMLSTRRSMRARRRRRPAFAS